MDIPDDKAQPAFGSDEFIARQLSILKRLIPLLEGFPRFGHNKRYELATPIVMALPADLRAIILLAENGLGHEIYPLLRSIIERITTYYYLFACDDNELNNYMDYSMQKTYRKSQAKMIINGKQYFRNGTSITIDKNNPQDEVPIDAFPDSVQSAVDKFTSKGGKPITRWSNTSLEKKLTVIDEAKVINVSLLMIAISEIYDDASEVLHGTLYGCTMHFGAFDPSFAANLQNQDTCYEDVNKRFKQHLSMLFGIKNNLTFQLCKHVVEQLKLEDRNTELKEIGLEIMSCANAQ